MALHMVSVWLLATVALVLYLAFLYSANRILEGLTSIVSKRVDSERGETQAELLALDDSSTLQSSHF